MTTEEEIVIDQHGYSYEMPYLLLSSVLLLVWPTLLRATVLFLPTMVWGGGEQTGPLSPSFTDPLLQTMVFQIICKSPLLQWPPRFVYPQHFCLRFSIFFIYWQIFPFRYCATFVHSFSAPLFRVLFVRSLPSTRYRSFLISSFFFESDQLIRQCWIFRIFSNLKIS